MLYDITHPAQRVETEELRCAFCGDLVNTRQSDRNVQCETCGSTVFYLSDVRIPTSSDT